MLAKIRDNSLLHYLIFALPHVYYKIKDAGPYEGLRLLFFQNYYLDARDSSPAATPSSALPSANALSFSNALGQVDKK